ncbi:ferritin-like domain-containing protein, partial [Streptomyces sp. ActVer]|uniref:ferritin-like domain-containing protein n=1 Tax=Streptomyces sp. ActVer TaxID=3014558 RepID=UPI0022B3D51C
MAGKAESKARALTAVQAALAAEHAAVYGYGVVGGKIGEDRRTEARAAYDAHRARRDELARTVRDLRGMPKPAAAAYALPFPVTDAESAVRLAAELEDRVAGVYSDLVRAAEGDRRRSAAGAPARWSPRTVGATAGARSCRGSAVVPAR